VGRFLLLGAVATTTASAIAVGGDGAGRTGPALLLAAFLAFAALMITEVRRPRLRRRHVWFATGFVVLVAIVVPPQSSHDLWSYAAYGRMVSTYHESPYTHSPQDHPRDPISRLVSKGWENNASVYGPVFTAVSAVGTAAAGDSPLRIRLFFQGLAGACLLGALAILHRRGAPAGALAIVGLNPLATASIVNNGHNDLLVGVAVLVGVLLARERRGTATGVALAFAVLVKAAAFVPLAAIAFWLWRRDRPAAVRAAAASGAMVAAGYAVAGGTAALAPLHQASGYVSASSFWHMVQSHDAGAGPSGIVVWGSVAIVVAAIAVGWQRRADPVAVTIAAVLGYLLAAPYALPWYVGWLLPVVALTWRSRLAWLATAYPAIALLVYNNRPVMAPAVRDFLLHVRSVLPVIEVAALLALVLLAWRRRHATDVLVPR
jgi:hypothetical protein